MSVGSPTSAMTLAIVKVLPEPVTPRSVWNLSPARTPVASSAMAVGWSPDGSKSLFKSKSAIIETGIASLRIGLTGLEIGCAGLKTGCAGLETGCAGSKTGLAESGTGCAGAVVCFLVAHVGAADVVQGRAERVYLEEARYLLFSIFVFPQYLYLVAADGD